MNVRFGSVPAEAAESGGLTRTLWITCIRDSHAYEA
jgi:hypothetical protein